MYNQPIEHELTNKFVDYDARGPKEFGTPYESYFTTVWQNKQVQKVSQMTNGEIMVHFENGMPFPLKNVVKIH
jgi:hypothetical protein